MGKSVKVGCAISFKGDWVNSTSEAGRETQSSRHRVSSQSQDFVHSPSAKLGCISLSWRTGKLRHERQHRTGGRIVSTYGNGCRSSALDRFIDSITNYFKGVSKDLSVD